MRPLSLALYGWFLFPALFVSGLITVAHSRPISPERASPKPAATPRIPHLVCTLSAFFSVDTDEVIKGYVRTDGRGLASCKNDQGFSTELPVMADLEISLPKALLKDNVEVGISLNTSPFVINRDINQLQDRYAVRRLGATSNEGTFLPLLVRGQRHDLFMEVKLTSQTARVSGMRLSSLRLSVDDSAPDLN